MNTKIIMIISSITMAVTGITASFMPDEILTFAGIEPVKHLSLLIQIMGAMYFAFSLINWFAKDNLIGGIYSKPIALGNFAHFMIGALALVKSLPSDSILLLSACVFYALFAILFGYISFTNPAKIENTI